MRMTYGVTMTHPLSDDTLWSVWCCCCLSMRKNCCSIQSIKETCSTQGKYLKCIHYSLLLLLCVLLLLCFLFCFLLLLFACLFFCFLFVCLFVCRPQDLLDPRQIPEMYPPFSSSSSSLCVFVVVVFFVLFVVVVCLSVCCCLFVCLSVGRKTCSTQGKYLKCMHHSFLLLLLCRGVGEGVREAGWKHGWRVTSQRLL